jgi:enamine deaminase RidA (YjgF/YER057c/UK114 family)
MARRLLSTGSPFERQGGYSRAVVDGDFCFVAGTTGYDYATMKMPVSVADQARNAFRTIADVLGDAGFALSDIVRATYYILDRSDADAVLAVCGEYLRDIRPAGTILIVAGLLQPEMKVEIEVTAKRRSSPSSSNSEITGA